MTSQRQAEVGEPDDLYRAALCAMSEGVVVFDARAQVVAHNASAARLLGWQADSSDRPWQAICSDGSPLPPDAHPANLVLQSGAPANGVELGIQLPAGQLSWVSVNAQPLLRDGESRPCGVVCTLVDITARRHSERGRQFSQDHHRSIVETSLEGIWTIDLEGRTSFANERMARILRCSVEMLESSSVWDFVAPAERPVVEQQLQQRARGLGEDHEFCFVAKDGSAVHASVAACAITLPDGRRGALAMVRDTTEQKRLLDQLQEARRLEAVGRLAGGIAHDFNNLLTAILTSVALAENSPDDLATHLETIRVASERAAGFTKQLLAFARKQLIRARPLSLSALVRDFTTVLPRLVGEQIETTVEVPETWPVLGDQSQLEQVLVNLVANARDAMPQGGRVVISTRDVTVGDERQPGAPDIRAGDYVLLTVRDTGGGIDQQARPHIFEPFFSTKAHGTGMGLATCYGIVKQLQGHIQVRAPQDGGTAFDVYLPRSAERPEERASTPRPPARRGHETVLIVEDDSLVCDALERALRHAGYHVLAAGDGEKALKLAEEYSHTINLLVSDVVMPRLSGPQLAERLTVLRPELQVLFVSGYLDQIALPEKLAGRSSHFLAKPYTLDTIVHTVRDLLDLPARSSGSRAR
jgi:PAS domain S-box-containing protein